MFFVAAADHLDGRTTLPYDRAMPFWFTFWFPIANAALTLILAAVTACFAWRQHNLDKNHLRAELFGRRVAVYDAMKRFVADITTSGTTTLESLMAMLRETRHAQFLFKSSDDITGFIKHFYKQGLDLKFTRQEHEKIRSSEEEPERLRLIQREHDLLVWFGEQGDAIDDKFRPYLQLA